MDDSERKRYEKKRLREKLKKNISTYSTLLKCLVIILYENSSKIFIDDILF
jgi:hypothetical protein